MRVTFRRTSSARVRLLVAVTLAAPAFLVVPPAVGAAADDPVLTRPGESVLVDRDETTIAPGMDLTTFSRLEDGGWNAGSILEVDLDAGITLDYQYSGSVTQPATVRSLAEASGATAAINGDFYDINNSNGPLGVGVSRDEGMITAPTRGHENAFAVADDGAVALAQVLLEGTVTVDGGASLALAGVNTFKLPADGIGVFTPTWGEYPRTTTVPGAAGTAEVVVTDGVVTSVGATVGTGAIPENAIVLVGREAGAAALLELAVGAAVEVSYAPRSDFGDVVVAVGGGDTLVQDGEQRTFSDTEPAARTAIGLSADGRTMYMVSLDGKQAHSRGMTLTEFAELMVDIGAHDALNIDGGGSSTLVVREPGTETRSVVNTPSDGSEREVSNGLALFAGEGSGRLQGFRVLSGDEGTERVFPGLTRTVTGLGHDETFAAVEGSPRWRESGSTVDVRANRDGTATVTGQRSGSADVVAYSGRAHGELEMTVLGELAWIDPSQTLVPLAGADDTATLRLTGYDAAGYRAPISAADVTVTGGEGVVELAAAGDGFTVRPLVDSGSALLTLSAGGISTGVAVTVGFTETPVVDFADATDWTLVLDRATGTIEPTEGPEGRNGVRVSYDFTGGNTRAAYATPPTQFEFPGQPQTVKAWVKGDGNGTWIRMRVYDPNGTLLTLNGGYTTFTGWQQISFPVLPGTEYPLSFRDIYAVEPRGDARYQGETSFSDITVEVAPDVELPVNPTFEDPVIVTNGTAEGADQRIAVMSDSQFIAADPDSDLVAAARRTLQEIVAAEPDLLVINGDFVDTATVADFDLARTVLDEELANVEFPWIYVPGNHEIQGGPITNFVEEFGPTNHVRDVCRSGEEQERGTSGSDERDQTTPHDGDCTRVITLNTSNGTLRAGGAEFAQIAELRNQLDAAAGDGTIDSVLVFGHHPPNDPLPTANSQLADRREAAMLETWLGEFRAGSGKPAAYVGSHAGVFHASSVDGVPYFVNGNSGKSPASTADNGGFTGWTMLGVENSHRRNEPWLQAEVRARVDSITLAAPTVVRVGQSAPVTATVEQDDGRTVPVAWPMSASWSGDRVNVDEQRGGGSWRDVVEFNPSTGELTALRPGTARLTVTVNGQSATATIDVTR